MPTVLLHLRLLLVNLTLCKYHVFLLSTFSGTHPAVRVQVSNNWSAAHYCPPRSQRDKAAKSH